MENGKWKMDNGQVCFGVSKSLPQIPHLQPSIPHYRIEPTPNWPDRPAQDAQAHSTLGRQWNGNEDNGNRGDGARESGPSPERRRG